MAKSNAFACELHADKRGVIWDLVLYIPTVGFLLLWGLKMYFGSEDNIIAYVLLSLGFFFLFVGFNRVSKRMLWTPKSPVGLDVDSKRVLMQTQNGETMSLRKDVRFFRDTAGKTFAITGLDSRGEKQQLIFYRGQFPSTQAYDDMVRVLDRYRS